MTRILACLALALAIVSSWPAASLAQRGHGYHGRGHYDHRGPERWHSGRWHRGWHGGHFGWWWVIGPSWYFYTAPVYPYPPPVVVVPAPAPAPPQAYVAPAPQRQPQPKPYCREYQGDAIINGTSQPFYGTACLQPDGTWRIVK